MRYILDTGILSLIMAKDERVKNLVDEIKRKHAEAYTTSLNMLELYYKIAERLGAETAKTWIARILHSEIKVVDFGVNSLEVAGELKLRHKKDLSTVDCIVITMAKALKGTVITTDERIRVAREVSTKYVRI